MHRDILKFIFSRLLMSLHFNKIVPLLLAGILVLNSCWNTKSQPVESSTGVVQSWSVTNSKTEPVKTGQLVTSTPYNKYTLTPEQLEVFYKTSGISLIHIPESFWDLFLDTDWNSKWSKDSDFTIDSGRYIILGFSKMFWTGSNTWLNVIYRTNDLQLPNEDGSLKIAAEWAKNAIQTGKIMNAILVDGVVWIITYGYVPSDKPESVHLQKTVTFPFEDHTIFVTYVFSEYYQDSSQNTLKAFYEWGFSKIQREQLQKNDELIFGIKFIHSGSLISPASTLAVQNSDVTKIDSGKKQYITRHGISYGSWTPDRKYFVFVQKPFIPVILEGPDMDVVPEWEDPYQISIINTADSTVKKVFSANKDAEIIPSGLNNTEFSFFHGADKTTIDLVTGAIK